MKNLMDWIEPQNDAEKEDFALEDLVLSIQISIQKTMERKGVTKKDLADRMGLSKARVSQILSAGPNNVTLRTVAKVAVALDEDFEFVSREQATRLLERQQQFAFFDVATKRHSSRNDPWKDNTANKNRYLDAAAA